MRGAGAQSTPAPMPPPPHSFAATKDANDDQDTGAEPDDEQNDDHSSQ
jgi:hypothetical protein